MNMISCHGCNKDMQPTATTCSDCGAPVPFKEVKTSLLTDNWYVKVLKKYAVFSGRARRKEYWMFFLLNSLVSMVLGATAGVIGEPGWISVGYSLAVLIPGIAVAVRRMHDVGRSGWWVLVPIVNLVFAIKAGDQGPNRFGADPKAA